MRKNINSIIYLGITYKKQNYEYILKKNDTNFIYL